MNATVIASSFVTGRPPACRPWKRSSPSVFPIRSGHWRALQRRAGSPPPRALLPAGSVLCRTRPPPFLGPFPNLKRTQHWVLLETEPLEVNGQRVVPRQVLHTLWEPQIRAQPDTRDFILISILALGLKSGTEAEARVELLHRYDAQNGVTAME